MTVTGTAAVTIPVMIWDDIDAPRQATTATGVAIAQERARELEARRLRIQQRIEAARAIVPRLPADVPPAEPEADIPF